VLRPELAPPRLTPPGVKQQLLEDSGVDEYVVLPPREEVLNLSAEQFWAILRDDVQPRHLIAGRTFTFGKDRGGTIDRLREWSSTSGISLHVVDPVTVPLLDLTVVAVSSSLIRWLLSHGRMRDAAICLGRPYALRGEVVRGFGRGKKLGVPTANLRCDDQLIPADGVYAARCTLDGVDHAAAVSIGTLPTFHEAVRQVEAHLLNYDGDLYGRTIEIRFINWVREQRKFASIDALQAYIRMDMQKVAQSSLLDAARPIGVA
jgi:riboflavin kinase / FMN adenylyltransferase